MNILCPVWLGNGCLAERFLSTWGGQGGIKTTLFDPGRCFSRASPRCSQGCSWERFCRCKAHTQGGGMIPCSGCFARRCAELPQRVQICVFIPACPCPQEHPAKLSFDAEPVARLQRYLCTSAAPGRPSAAAGRC